MLIFENDYSHGAHPRVLQRLIDTNMEPLSAYGSDSYSISAKERIKNACECPEAEVYFLAGGTQTNQIIISSMLKSYEGVIAAESGHIALHEAGAIEYCGNKVITLPQKEGKIPSAELKKYLESFFGDPNHEHMAFPAMVYISHPTEYGTLYSKKELAELSQICRDYNIPLYLDGARLGYGIAATENGVSLKDIAALCDVFYIGGTKMGALCGEAAVFTKNNAPKHFTTVIKQHGALMAKGRLTGIQFDALFTDGLYFEIGKYSIQKAKELKNVFKEKGYSFFLESPTNQQFVILENKKAEEIAKKCTYSFWERLDSEHIVARFATSWATADSDIDELRKIL